MKHTRISVALLFLLCTVLAGCGSLRTYKLDEILPNPVDDATLLPLIASIEVIRAADGASVTVSGPEVETLMLSFGSLTCTKKQTDGVAAAYTVTFFMTDTADVPPALHITMDTAETDPYLQYGEYVYYPVNTRLDVAYLESLFG